MSTNPGLITTMGTNPSALDTGQLKDGVDNIHSGIIKSLQIATGENRALSGFGLTQVDGGSTTSFQVATGTILRAGKLVSVSGATLTTTTSQISVNSVDWYGVIVVNSSDALAWRFGAQTGKANNSTSTVAELSAGDIPVIIVKITAGSDSDATDRPHQYVGYTQTDRAFSAIASSAETLRIKTNGTVLKAGNTGEISFPSVGSSARTLATTNDIASLGTSNLADDAVTAAKLASDAVVTASIADSNVTTAKIADDAITFAKMQHTTTNNRLLGAASAGAIGEVQVATAMIADDAVTSAKIDDGTIVEGNVANDAITYAKIQNVSATNRILGRDSSGAGNIEEITPANLLTMLGVEASADVTDTANVKTALNADMGGDFTIGNQSNDTATFSGHLAVGGNLTVSGTTTTVNSNTVNIGDSIITLNSDATGSASEDAGIEVERGDDANKTLIWDESAGRWTVGSETFVAGTFIGNLTGTVSSATALANARNFALSGDVTASAVSFDGSGNVTLSTALAGNTVNTTELVNSAVSEDKIAGNAVTSAKIASSAVATAKIADDAVTTAKIADDAITTALIADDAITSALIADDAIVSAAIADGAVTNAHLAGSIAQAKVTNLTSDLSGKEPSLTISEGLNRTGSTLKVDIDSLSVENAIHLTNDFIMYDDADAGLRKITLSNIFAKLQASDIPSLAASAIGSGTLDTARIPNLAASKIDSGTFATARIADDAITFAKLQDVGTGVLLGRTTSGTGDVETLSASAARTFLNVDTAGTDNSTDVTLAGSRDYLTLSGQAITVGEIDISDDTNLVAGTNISLSGDTLNVDTDLANYSNSNSGFLTAHPTISNAASSVNNSGRTYIQDITLDSNGHIIGIQSATETVTDTQYSVGDGGLSQNNFTNILKTKLDGIAANANNFTLPIAESDVLGGVKIGSNLTINAGTGVLSADTQSDVNFTSTLNSKLAGIASGATAGADFASNVSNISVTNAQLAGSIANSKLVNSSVTVNGSTVALGGSITLTTANVAEGSNLYYTDERVDDRVNALVTDGEGITTTYDDSSGTLTIDAEDATASNKGVASFASADFDISSGAVSVKSGGISNSQLAGSIANSKLDDIAQSKVTGLVSALAGKVSSLSDLSITATATEINALDGIPATLTATEIGFLDGVTSAIQTQLDAKQASGNYLSTSSPITSLSGITAFDTDLTAVSGSHDSVPSAKAVKAYVDLTSFDANDTQYTFSVEDTGSANTKKLKLTGTDSSATSVNFEGSGSITVTRINERIIIDSTAAPVNAVSYSGNTLTLSKTDSSTITATIPDATTSAHGLMTDDQFDKLAGIETAATADQTAAEIRTLVESASDSNVFTDADHSKLNAIEASADVTDTANVKTALGAAMPSNTLTIGDGSTAVTIPGALTVTGTVTTNNVETVSTSNGVIFEGNAADANEVTLLAGTVSADRTITLPDATGTLLLTDGSGASLTALNGSQITSGTVAAARVGVLPTSKITTGTFADARISEGSVTQHQAALSITESQISDLDAYLTAPRSVTAGGNTLANSETLAFTAGSNITISESGGAVTIASTDTNTQLTTEQVQDIVGDMVSSNTETNISVTYDDTGGKLNFASTDTNTQLSQEQVEDFVNGVIVAGSNITKTYDDASGTLTIASTDTNTQLTTEQVEDIVGAMVSSNTETNITVTYDDTNGKLDFSSTNTNTQLSQENVEDFVGGMLDGTETFISVSYDDTDGNLDFVVPVLDEDNMATNSASHLATQQSIKAYVDTEVAGLVDSAPGALNTLNELAAAINDDATFSSTVTTALGNRLRVDTSSQGLSGTQQANARTNLNVDVAGTDNSTDVTLATVSNNYLSISGQAITAGTVPLTLGGTGATSASAARSALGVDAAGTDNSTDVTLTGSGNYLSISGQAITVDPIDISDDTNLTAGTGLTLSGDTLNVDAAQSGITSVGTLSSLTVSGDLTVDTNALHVDSTNTRVGIGTTSPGFKLQVNGSFGATTKSFVIPHPTKQGKTLQHGSLEGPEHGVYYRGRLEGDMIQLPEYWTELVDEDTITVQLTPNGDFQMLFVEKIEDNQVFVANAADEGIDCFYIIHGERKDVGKMEVEY